MNNLILFSFILSVMFSVTIITPAYAFWDFGGWEKKYNLLFDENEELKNEIERLELKVSKILKLYDTQKHKIDVLNNEVSNLESKSTHWKDQTYEYYEKLLDSNDKFNDKVGDYNELVDDYNVLDKTYDKQIDNYNELVGDYNVLDKTYDKQIDNYNELVDDYNVLDKTYDKQIDNYNELVDDYKQVYDEAFKPRTEIDKTKIKWTIQDSKGNRYGINWDFKSYEDLKIHSDYKSTHSKPTYLNLDGQRITTTNLEGFVKGTSFDCCIDELYDNSESNRDFIWEVWYIVSQMTVYDSDVNKESEGRYALETLVRQGGDCEDLVILIAEMLKSSSHTKNWDIQYVYMDSDNPLDAQTVNHVILSVDDGQDNYLIEATGDPNYDYYPDGVSGWYFDV